jgi:hypothetical protein
MEVRCAIVGLRRYRRSRQAIERGENSLRPKLDNDAIDFVVACDVPTTLMSRE